MATSTIAKNGRVTLPKVVHDALGLEAGDQVEFVVREDGVVELIPRTRPLMSLAGTLGERRLGLSVEELGWPKP
jgi:antitoxin PrlF